MAAAACDLMFLGGVYECTHSLTCPHCLNNSLTS